MIQTITIDGPAASGKGVLARHLAEYFDYFYLDTGKIYRLIGLMAHEAGIEPGDNVLAMEEIAKTLAKNFTLEIMNNPDLKSDLAGQMASKSGAIPEVRTAILNLQRQLVESPPQDKDGIVLDGRDCGTIICPQAIHKFFITADQNVRAMRRFKELKMRDDNISFEMVLSDMKMRDARDFDRDTVPTKPADDATIIDTTNLDADETFKKVLSIIEE